MEHRRSWRDDYLCTRQEATGVGDATKGDVEFVKENDKRNQTEGYLHTLQ
jgi:hypothetical protein